MRVNKRVLVVDDEEAIVEGVSMLLDCEKIENAGARDRGDAVSILSEKFFPVMVTDLCLHTVDEGLQLIADARRLSPGTKVMVLSGNVTPETEQELLQSGVAAVLQKPAASDELIAAVRELLEMIEAEAQTAAENDLDLEQLYLTVRKKLYAIPRKRFGLSHERAEDVLQEAWLLFLQKRGLIRAAAPWLAGAVANLSRQQIDQRTRKREDFDGDQALALFEDSGTGNTGDIVAVRQALSRIDGRARTLCALIGMEGFSYEEVSEATGMPVGSVGPLYIRAKKKLKNALSH